MRPIIFAKDKLMRDGVQAQALVLEKKVFAFDERSGRTEAWRYVLRVRFADTVEELDQRLGVVYAAQTRSDVQEVIAGLPPLAPPTVAHRFGDEQRRDEAPPLLPDWLRAGDPAARVSPASQARPSARPAYAGAAQGVPTDEDMQAAYDRWRSAVTKAKAARRASKVAESAGDKRSALRQRNESARLTAAERSQLAKFNDLKKLRPDWTSAPS